MGPISADITKYVRTREAATGVHAQGVIGPKELEDPVLVSYQDNSRVIQMLIGLPDLTRHTWSCSLAMPSGCISWLSKL